MIWIDKQEPLDAAMERVAAQPVVAIDTEADSLHSYFDKVCLIQMSIPGEDLVIDPLARVDLARFGQILGDPKIMKIFHGGDYDLRILNRDFGFTISNLVDTMISAQLLGYEAYGLAALLERHFGIKVNKTHQRADWAMRPLTPDMLDYAATDTRYLIELYGKLREELTALDRWEWAVEEFGRLEQVRYTEKEDDGEQFRRLKGIGSFDRRSLAIVRDLYIWRDGLARAADRPPFKIIGNDSLMEIAKEKPVSQGDLGKMKGVSRYHSGRYGNELVNIVRHALDIADSELPQKVDSRPWIRDKALEARVEKLKRARDVIAKELKLDPAILAPRHILTAVATVEPKSIEELAEVPVMREWQKRVLGSALISALH